MPAKRDNAMSGREPHEAGEDEVLTLQEVAAWLKVTPRQVLRLGIPCLDLGHKTKRFLARDVRAWLERLRDGGKR